MTFFSTNLKELFKIQLTDVNYVSRTPGRRGSERCSSTSTWFSETWISTGSGQTRIYRKTLSCKTEKEEEE